MEQTNITTTIHFHVKDHNKVVKFFEEMGFQTYSEHLTNNSKYSGMYLHPTSDFRISISEDPECDNTGTMTMEIVDDRYFATHFTTAFTLKEENFIPRAKSDLESN